MRSENTASQSAPQADGDSRPFDTKGHTGPVRVHLEKSGPAFSQQDDFRFVDHLVQSLQSGALKSAGEVLNALRRRCLLDVCASWPRLLMAAGVTSLGARRLPRERWEWDEMREAVELALCYAEQPDSLKWQEADATLRGYAANAALVAQSHLGNVLLTAEDAARIRVNVITYRAFAEGRA